MEGFHTNSPVCCGYEKDTWKEQAESLFIAAECNTKGTKCSDGLLSEIKEDENIDKYLNIGRELGKKSCRK